jgi:outer membrane protein assembly factor BamB
MVCGRKSAMRRIGGHHASIAALLACALVGNVAAGDDWPQFRGPTGDGIATARDLPLRWSPTENIRWRAPLPGVGRSSPVLLGDRIWLTAGVVAPPAAALAATSAGPLAASAAPLSLRLLCLDRGTGRLLYDVELLAVDRPEPLHPLNSHATPTPVVEPGRVYCDFGSYGTVCADAATGRVVWKQRLAVDHQLGPASSPALFGARLFLVRDGCDFQYVAALDTQTGAVAWKRDRPPFVAESGPYKKSFSSPLVIRDGGRMQVVAIGPHWIVAYEPESGGEIWRAKHGTGYSIAPRPVFGHGLVYACTGGYVAELLAFRTDGHGDVTDSHVAWKATAQIPLMSSPILVGDELYFVFDSGIVSCLDARSGKLHWRERIGGNFCASPLAADGRLYLVSREGKTTVLQPGRKFVRLAECTLEGPIIASPAAVGQSIYLRTDKHLFCIEKTAPP